MLARIVTVLLSAFFVTILGTVAHILLFGVARSMLVPVLLRLPIVSRFLRPFLAHFLRDPLFFTLLPRQLGILFRAFMLGYTTVATWDFAESLFDAFVAEVRFFAHHSYPLC
jgi:nucleoporin NDC1